MSSTSRMHTSVSSFLTIVSVYFSLTGFESILEGIYGPMLLSDLNLFDGGFLCWYIKKMILITLCNHRHILYLFSTKKHEMTKTSSTSVFSTLSVALRHICSYDSNL